MKTKTHLLTGSAIFIFLIVLVINSWASDDAFITMRTVRNILEGYGPRWNAAERVQVFTHPLWMIILIPFYYAIKDPYFTLYVASLLFSGITVLFLLSSFSASPWTKLLALSLVISSKAFVDYSSSGLENPLTHFLVILFFWLLLRNNLSSDKRLIVLALVASITMLNRLDTILILTPAILLEIWSARHPGLETVKILLLGLHPSSLGKFFRSCIMVFHFQTPIMQS